MPIVCYDISGAPRDIVKNYRIGIVADRFDWNAIVEGIVYYYRMWKNDKREFERLSQTCRNVALKYDWRVVAPAFDKMFREILIDRSHG